MRGHGYEQGAAAVVWQGCAHPAWQLGRVPDPSRARLRDTLGTVLGAVDWQPPTASTPLAGRSTARNYWVRYLG